MLFRSSMLLAAFSSAGGRGSFIPTATRPVQRRRCERLAGIACGLLLGLQAQATVLTFETGGTLPLDYGDNIDQATVNGISYPEGTGYTPNVTVDIAPVASLQQYTVWPHGYGPLLNALGHGQFDVPGELVFTPDPSYRVILRGFDLATWSAGSYQTNIRIWDDLGSFAAPNLFSFDQLLLPNIAYQPLSGAVTGQGALHLYISNLGSTGLDNVSFSQAAAVPLPAAIWFLVPALALIGARRRKS